MELFQLGRVCWEDSQLIYHALARLGREALVLLSPDSPYVCLGYHQDPQQEVDLDFCRTRQIPVFRREVGGGAVYLDGSQLFYQLILRKDNPVIPAHKSTFYRKFLQPVINTYRQVGIQAEYKPVNDIVVNSRKISGNGVGEIGDCLVLVGNLILDFDYDMMSRVLKVPDEKFRDKVSRTLSENLTTIRRELGLAGASQLTDADLYTLLKSEFEQILGTMTPAELDQPLRDKAAELSSVMMAPEWLFQLTRKDGFREIKIRDGVRVINRVLKTTGGLMRADFEIQDNQIRKVNFSGDFFCYPRDAIRRLESLLEGKSPVEIEGVLEDFYADPAIEIPGINVKDWLSLLTE